MYVHSFLFVLSLFFLFLHHPPIVHSFPFLLFLSSFFYPGTLSSLFLSFHRRRSSLPSLTLFPPRLWSASTPQAFHFRTVNISTFEKKTTIRLQIQVAYTDCNLGSYNPWTRPDTYDLEDLSLYRNSIPLSVSTGEIQVAVWIHLGRLATFTSSLGTVNINQPTLTFPLSLHPSIPLLRHSSIPSPVLVCPGSSVS